ncbi:MAG: hypothetical protein ACU83O_14920, partial [Gammaproteobacteria bacterium]
DLELIDFIRAECDSALEAIKQSLEDIAKSEGVPTEDLPKRLEEAREKLLEQIQGRNVWQRTVMYHLLELNQFATIYR